MKYKKILIIIFVITGLILFLKYMNVLQVENKLGNPFMMVLLIVIFSVVAIHIQKSIDSNYNDNRIHYDNLDILKYICSILIVFLHLRPFLNFSDQLDLAFNNIITRICVPIFFVITGYFVAKKEKDNPNYIKDYIKKMIPLYLIWSILYVPVVIATIIQHFPIINQYLSDFSIPLLLLLIILLPIAVFISLIYTGIYYHLWYFPAVMLSLVVLNKWKKKFSIRYLLLISFFLLLFGATETYYGVLPLSVKHLLSFYYAIFFTTRNFLFFGLFYVVLGYWMGLKKQVYSNYCFEKLIISIFLLIFEALLLHDTERLNSNILLSCLPLVYYLFICVIYLPKPIKTNFPFRNLSKYYYLVHPMMIFLFSISGIINADTNPYIQMIIILLTTHLLSIFIIKLKKKYKWLMV